MAYQAPPLHGRNLAIAPVAVNDDLFVAAEIVGVAEMGTGKLGVCGEGGAANEKGIVRRDPLTGKARVWGSGVMEGGGGGGGGVLGGRGWWWWQRRDGD